MHIYSPIRGDKIRIYWGILYLLINLIFDIHSLVLMCAIITNIPTAELIAVNPVYSCDIQSLSIYSWHIQNIAAYSRYIRTCRNMRLAILARLLPIYSWHIRITLNFKKMDRPMWPRLPTYCRYIQTCMIPPHVKKLAYWWHICCIVIVRLWLMGVQWIWN